MVLNCFVVVDGDVVSAVVGGDILNDGVVATVEVDGHSDGGSDGNVVVVICSSIFRILFFFVVCIKKRGLPNEKNPK